MKKFSVSFNQTVVKQWVVTVEADNEIAAMKMVEDEDYKECDAECIGESDEGWDSLEAEEVEE